MESSKWSRDWRQFDWDVVIKKFDQAERAGALYREKNPDIGISAEEFLEYLDWLRECDSLLFLATPDETVYGRKRSAQRDS